jgi:hypothetical protein
MKDVCFIQKVGFQIGSLLLGDWPSLNKIRVLMMAMGVFEEEKVGVRPAMGLVVERNPNRPFHLKFGLLKVAVLFAAKIT